MKKIGNILIIRNPRAGKGRNKFFDTVLGELDKQGVKYRVRQTEYAGHGCELARKHAQDSNFDAVIAAGGDGTINEVINGLVKSEKAFGIIPMGTANVLAKEIGLRDDASQIAATIASSKCRNIYLAKINDQLFTLMASVGFDALAVRNVNLKLKKKIGHGAYIVSLVKQLIYSKNIEYHVEIDDFSRRSFGAIITNGKYYAGKYICAPEARLDQKMLYAILFKKNGKLNALRYFLAILMSRLHKLSDVEILQVTHARISSDKPAPVQVDGDHFGALPVTITTAQKPLLIIAP